MLKLKKDKATGVYGLTWVVRPTENVMDAFVVGVKIFKIGKEWEGRLFHKKLPGGSVPFWGETLKECKAEAVLKMKSENVVFPPA